MTSKPVLPVEEAAGLIRNGETLTVSGIGGLLLPEKVLAALEARFISEGEPRDLTWFDPSPTGAGPGFEHLAHEGMLKRVIESYFTGKPELTRMVVEEQVEAYSFGLGSLHLLTRDIATGRSGHLTKVGLNTYMDPRQQGGKLNRRAQEDLVELVEVKGDEYLFYKAFPINVALIRGTTADEEGNITMEEEPVSAGALFQALAAKRSGGRVIAQVKRLAAKSSLHARQVVVPGLFVDAIVVDEQQHQSENFPDREVAGIDPRVRAPEPPRGYFINRQGKLQDALPLDADKLVARRAALELRPGQVINAGGGIPHWVLMPLTLEEQCQDLIDVSLEHGVLGGTQHGSAWHLNPTAFMDYQTTFTFFQGGGLDTTFLGMGEMDKEGNVNVCRFGGLLSGPGGAVDIAHDTKKIVFCGTFTAGVQIQATGGKLRIIKEGKARKLVDRVELVCFNGRQMWEQGKEVLYITERAVFRLGAEGPVLVEKAPGADVERDILQQMGFRPRIAPNLQEVDGCVFSPGLMGLRSRMTNLAEA